MIETKAVTLSDGAEYRFASLSYRQCRTLIFENSSDPLMFPFEVIAAAMNNASLDEPYHAEGLRAELTLETFLELYAAVLEFTGIDTKAIRGLNSSASIIARAGKSSSAYKN
jgi:hypothetical protein